LRRIWRVIAAGVATVMGAGYFPLAPGTAGSIVSTGLYYALSPDLLLRSILAAFFLAAGYWGCIMGKRFWGSDPSRVVVDEFAGCWLACMAVPQEWGLIGLLAAFALFRIFDIFKPWPVRVFDRMDTPAGILLDDVAAGIMAALLIALGTAVHAAV
jgi:phosphatidylglycerophosphatase A